jgi:translation initiation factor IF-3
MALLQRIRDDLGDTILVEQFPKLEGRQMIMMIAPGKKKPAPPSPPPKPQGRPCRRDDGAVRQIQSHHGWSPRWR